jgi:hypothetical protein
MTGRRVAAAALGLLVMTGCAGAPLRPTAGVTVAVTPDTVHPGDVVTVRVEVPAGAKTINGRLGVSGSPVLPLRSRDNGRTWTFTTQIPIDAIWQPGRYKVEIRGEGSDGAPLYAETWITAP